MRTYSLMFFGLLLISCPGCGDSPVEKETKREKPPLFAKAKSAWLESHEAAVAQSNESGKPILALFTGSDWCRYCALLDHQVFTSPAFVDWSRKSVILLKLDFPKEKQLTAEVKRQNDSLMARYGVTGFPTVLLLNVEGEAIHRTGYQSGSAEDWIASVDSKLQAYRTSVSNQSGKGN